MTTVLDWRPRLSCVMVTQTDYEACRRTIGFLKRQTALDQLELVLVAESRDALALDEADVACFPAVEVVEFGEIRATGPAVVAGILAARADWVVFNEEHSFPEPEWAARLITAQEGPWAVIGCAVSNANPGTLTSWAHLFGQFGPVVAPVESGEADYIAGHHSSYLREALLPFGESLGALFEFEVALHHALRAQGHRLYLAGDAVASHVQVSRPGAYIQLDYLGQRGFGARRWQSQGWSWARRLLYAAASPLFPPLRLARTTRDVWRAGRGRGLIPWIFPLMGLAMVAGAVGEVAGYLFGAGSVAADRIEMELDRYAFTTEADRAKRPTA
jgi:hypothetical protein